MDGYLAVPVIIIVIEQTIKHCIGTNQMRLKIPVIGIFWSLAAIYSLNMMKSYVLLQKLLVLNIFTCFYVLTQELVFFEEFLSLSSDSEKSTLEELYMSRSRSKVLENEIIQAIDKDDKF